MGLSPNGGMIGSDVIIAWVGKVYFTLAKTKQKNGGGEAHMITHGLKERKKKQKQRKREKKNVFKLLLEGRVTKNLFEMEIEFENKKRSRINFFNILIFLAAGLRVRVKCLNVIVFRKNELFFLPSTKHFNDESLRPQFFVVLSPAPQKLAKKK